MAVKFTMDVRSNKYRYKTENVQKCSPQTFCWSGGVKAINTWSMKLSRMILHVQKKLTINNKPSTCEIASFPFLTNSI